MPQKELTHEAAKAYLEITDRLYIIAEQTGMTDDWVQETATQIANEVKNQTGVSLEEA